MLIKLFRTSDSQIIKGILEGGREKQISENNLYEKYLYFIREGTKKYQLDEDESASIYSDAILTVIDHIISSRFEGRSELKTYLYQIFSNQCVSFIRKKTTNKSSSTYDTVLLSEIMHPMMDNTQKIIFNESSKIILPKNSLQMGIFQ